MKSAHLCILMQSSLFQMRMNGVRRNELSRKVCGWLVCGGIAAVEDMRQAYIVKHIRTLLSLKYAPNFYRELQAMGLHRLQWRRK